MPIESAVGVILRRLVDPTERYMAHHDAERSAPDLRASDRFRQPSGLLLSETIERDPAPAEFQSEILSRLNIFYKTAYKHVI